MGENQKRHARAWIIAIAAVVVVAGALVLFGPHVGSGQAVPPQRGHATTVLTQPKPVAGGNNPSAADGGPQVAVAVNWAINYHSARWVDLGPTAWVNRTLPYITPKLASNYQQDNAGSTGDWATFVAHQCTTVLAGPKGIVPTEAPRTANSVYVDISGTAVTTCTNGTAPAPSEKIAATVHVVQSDGAWLVDGQVS